MDLRFRWATISVCKRALLHGVRIVAFNHILIMYHFLQAKNMMYYWVKYVYTSTVLQLHIGLSKMQIQFSDGISNHESIIYNFEVQMPSWNQVTAKCCILQNYDYYIMITLLPNKVKRLRHMSVLKKIVTYLFLKKVNFILSWKLFMLICFVMFTWLRSEHLPCGLFRFSTNSETINPLDCNFICCLWVWSLVSSLTGRT